MNSVNNMNNINMNSVGFDKIIDSNMNSVNNYSSLQFINTQDDKNKKFG
jgi:hypothetical protein